MRLLKAWLLDRGEITDQRIAHDKRSISLFICLQKDLKGL
jgi:hypothetical protein